MQHLTKGLRTGAKAAALSHILVTGMSIMYGTFGGYLERPPQMRSGKDTDAARHLLIWLPELDGLVRDMYSGRGIHQRYLPSGDSAGTVLKVGQDILFEDAAAVCSGAGEVAEAFRALKFLRPESLSAPIRAEVGGLMPQHVDLRITYLLHQRYAGILTVRSLLVVDVAIGVRETFNKAKDISSVGTTARVLRFEERWNGVEPLDWGPFRVSRRLNGVISWMLTSLALPADNTKNPPASK